eukprot:Protomagalhaensia_wolfi_Nauph_80__1340@NODE_179_length_3278_cov_264_687249_g135_i0_p2_GENE_NODE_179_length_3278_cov_264_687249_g135_i0NODE_179_length_3278_cov_264_687249_g135_i0_p2_ORF_typecomplete_len301_score28_91_NODE_179_length_3278_cov_264_687249_g135_i013752277
MPASKLHEVSVKEMMTFFAWILVLLTSSAPSAVQIDLLAFVTSLPCPYICPGTVQSPFVAEEIQACQYLLDSEGFSKCFLGVRAYFSGRSSGLSDHRDLVHGSVLDVQLLKPLEDLLRVTKEGVFERSILLVHLPAPAIATCTYYRVNPLPNNHCPDSFLWDTSNWDPIGVVGPEEVLLQFRFDPHHIHFCLLSSCSVAETGMNLADSQIDYSGLQYTFKIKFLIHHHFQCCFHIIHNDYCNIARHDRRELPFIRKRSVLNQQRTISIKHFLQCSAQIMLAQPQLCSWIKTFQNAGGNSF